MEKIIHQIWVGPYEIPDREKYFIQKNAEINSNFKFILWKDNNLPQLPTKISKICNNFYKRKDYAFVADAIRIFLVWKYGGLYMDVDMRPNNSIDELCLENYNGFFAYHNEFTVPNGYFGCAKQSGFINHLYNLLLKSKIGQDYMPFWFNSGVKEYFNIKEVHDYSSEECQIIGRQLLKKWDENNIKYVKIHGEFEKYYSHFDLNSWDSKHKNYFSNNNINYSENIYKIKYK